MGCDAWDNLKAIDNAINEPMVLWIPEKDSIKYVFGIEVSEPVSIEGYELIELEESDYLEFKSEPYNDENYQQVIESVQTFINQFDYSTFNVKINPNLLKIQLEPIGSRGYIELVPVTKTDHN